MIPVLQTERLTLRGPELSDLDAYAEYGASPRTAYVGGPFNRAQAFDRLSNLIGHWHLRGFGRWIIADQDTNAPLGIVGLYYPEDWPEPEIAWSVFADAEGRGIAYEAALVARTYAYETLGWTTAISLIIDGNTRSFALAERLGARFEKIYTHPEYGEMAMWRHPGPEALQ
ncbi:GNAT family N-acetyltransferase [Pseudaestuariivita rosea]|uniref:GNAT family N-acetyltransferase n=1 Tax=Pseudaestuariivita rosea TaxID=2763263 RepID=UPI001ABA4416|nr:GNAT family N-acetyltransferase [Pseudaestuariivita rosea]